MSTLAESAKAKFASGYNCSQSVLYAACDRLAYDQDTALKIACAFGAGMGREQEVCGAVSGGVLALSLRYGRGANDGPPYTENTYGKTRELFTRFRALHGSVACRELLGGCNLQTDEGQQQFRARNLKETVCMKCVASVADLVDEML